MFEAKRFSVLFLIGLFWVAVVFGGCVFFRSSIFDEEYRFVLHAHPFTGADVKNWAASNEVVFIGTLPTNQTSTCYEVAMWSFPDSVRGMTKEEFEFRFKDTGFSGNGAAFVSWVMANGPNSVAGWYVSFPSSDKELIPSFWKVDVGEDLLFFQEDDGGSSRVGFVGIAFKEISCP